MLPQQQPSLSLPLGDKHVISKNDPFAGSGLSSIWGNGNSDFGDKNSIGPNSLVPPKSSNSYVSDTLTSSPFNSNGTQLEQQLGFKQPMLGKSYGSSFLPSSSTNSFDSFSSSLFSPNPLNNDITTSFGLTPIGTPPIGTPGPKQQQQQQQHDISGSKFSQFFGKFPQGSGEPSSSPVPTSAFAFSPPSAQSNKNFDSPYLFGKDTANLFNKDANSLFSKNSLSPGDAFDKDSILNSTNAFSKSNYDGREHLVSNPVSTAGTLNEEITSTNTFPAYDDFTPGVFLPNDLLSASSSNTSFLSSLHQKTVGNQEKSSSYYSLSPISSKSASGNQSAQGSEKLSVPGDSLGFGSLTSPASSVLSPPPSQNLGDTDQNEKTGTKLCICFYLV